MQNGQWQFIEKPNDDEESKGENNQRDASDSLSGNFLKRFKLVTHSFPIIHTRVKGMIVDNRRNILYSTGKEGIIHAHDLAKKTTYGALRCKNSSPECLEYE